MIDKDKSDAPPHSAEGTDDDVLEIDGDELGETEKGLEVAPVGDEAINEELAKLQQEVSNLKELYLRKLADFDNYRKRQEREMGDFRRLANAGLIRDCLPVLDNLERALGAPAGDATGLRQGVELVLRQYKEVLGRYGLVEIDPMGEAFDPTLHEAIQRREVADVTEITVVQVLQKGYRMGDKLLRPALVIVAVPAKKAEQPASESDSGA
ncbi:MAG TPA: nucleotide exchange factor GrpE [Thermoanaerobaculaceae bacterium]|nr:nucleotide exchange factor GrpE [Thermoanaerobaculaceae bacterium]